MTDANIRRAPETPLRQDKKSKLQFKSFKELANSEEWKTYERAKRQTQGFKQNVRR